MSSPEIDLLDEAAFVEHKHEWFSWLRDNDPVYWHEEPDAPGFWVVSKHVDVTEINRNTTVFSSDRRYGGVIPFEERKLAATNQFASEIPNMLTSDPPEHTRFRKLLNRGFTPHALMAAEDHLRDVAADLVQKAVDSERCDWVETVAAWLPITAVGEMVGVPESDYEQLFTWANRMVAVGDAEYSGGLDDMIATVFEVFGYVQSLIDDRRANPRDDIMTTLIAPDKDGEILTDFEVQMFVVLLLTAGSETTRNAISQGLIYLAGDQDLYQQLRADPLLRASATEELLRWATPVTNMRRTAVSDLELHGKTIKAGDKVTIWYTSANRDADVFPHPYTFDARRDPNPHTTFGAGGVHYCMGAALARMEIRLMLEEMFERVESFSLTGEPVNVCSNMINGIKHLPLELVPAARGAVT